MKRVRLVGLAAAIVLTAIQWAAFFSPLLYTGSARAVDAAVTHEVCGGDSPEIVVATYRESFLKY